MALKMSSKLLGGFELSCFLMVSAPANAQPDTVHQLGVLEITTPSSKRAATSIATKVIFLYSSH